MLIVLFCVRIISILPIMVRATKEKPAVAKKPKKVNGYKFPEKLPEGEILKDLATKHWILGKSIGKGGFGEIYSASKYEDGKFDKSYPYVVKIEPHENGPLFVERNFYIKFAKPEDVQAYMAEKKLKILGIPTYIASGNHEYKNEKYRFLVIEKYGKDLWSLFLENKQFPPETVFRCAIQILDVLEYIHSRGYIHGDIKGANLLLSIKKGFENNVFLVDYGLACKYSTKEFKKNPKEAHTGTIEYTSCDWHLGVPTRRGDLEILGYNLLHWLSSSLPWEKDIANNEKVHEKKQELMENIQDNMKKHFPSVSNVMVKYLTYIANMEPNAAPDYDHCRNLFVTELKKMSCPINGELKFNPVEPEVPKKVKTTKKKAPRSAPKRGLMPLNEDISEPENEIPVKKRSVTKYVVDEEENCHPELINKRQTRSNSKTVDTKCLDSDDDIIPGTPEKVVKKRVNTKKDVKASSRDAPTVQANMNIGDDVPKTKAKKVDKPSWRDAPTIQANMNKGEDVPKTKAKKVDKPTWRDAPTIQANMNKGEDVPKTKPKRKVK